MTNHEIHNGEEHPYIGRTWCGKWINRPDTDEPWSTLRGEPIVGHAKACGNCRRAKAANRCWGEPQTKEGTRHQIQVIESGRGRTWCGRRVTRGGSAVPWCFASGQVATRGDEQCQVCESAKAWAKRREAKRTETLKGTRTKRTIRQKDGPMNDAQQHKETGPASGWVLYEGDDPVGAGPSMHAAIADGRRRTGWPENNRQRLEPATTEEWRRAASRLGPGGLTTAEAAWCAGTMNTVPVYRRSVDAAGTVLTAAERLGGIRKGLTVAFDDKSKLELVPLRDEVGGGHLIRLPPDPRTKR